MQIPVFPDMAVWRLLGNCYMLTRGARFPQGHSIQLPWRNGPSHQQEQPTAGRSLDGRIQRLLLYNLTRYRAKQELLFDYMFFLFFKNTGARLREWNMLQWFEGIYKWVRDLLLCFIQHTFVFKSRYGQSSLPSHTGLPDITFSKLL